MTRKEGFIDIDKILRQQGVNIYNISSSPCVTIIENDEHKILFSFEYQNEIYYFKYDANTIAYDELVAAELASDYGIKHIDYDLAVWEDVCGVISKNYKEENANFIEGYEILSDYWDKYPSEEDKELDGFITNANRTYVEIHNNLDDIWDALEYRYQNREDKREIITDLMKRIIDIFIFDIITCQSDRHSLNWGIIEKNGIVDIIPLYDNERILANQGKGASISLTIDSDGYMSLFTNIKKFINVSSDEFRNLIKEKLNIISDDNLSRVFERISNKTEYPMSDSYKEYYLMQFRKHRKNIENILIEEEIIRKR